MAFYQLIFYQNKNSFQKVLSLSKVLTPETQNNALEIGLSSDDQWSLKTFQSMFGNKVDLNLEV